MIAVYLTVLYQQGPRRQVADAPSSQPTTPEVPVPRANFAIGRPRRRKHYRVQRPKSRPVTQSNLSSRLSAFPTALLTYLEENLASHSRIREQTRDREVKSQEGRHCYRRQTAEVDFHAGDFSFFAKRFSCSHVPLCPMIGYEFLEYLTTQNTEFGEHALFE